MFMLLSITAYHHQCTEEQIGTNVVDTYIVLSLELVVPLPKFLSGSPYLEEQWAMRWTARVRSWRIQDFSPP
jgi:hypothetical protein